MAKGKAINLTPKAPKDVIIVGNEEEVVTDMLVEEGVEVLAEELIETEKPLEVEGAKQDETVPEGSNPIEDFVEESKIEEVQGDTELDETKGDDTPSVEFIAKTSAKLIPDRNVKIRVGKNYSCTVGGERYFFEKDKTYNVPKNVKDVLSKEENLLKPL